MSPEALTLIPAAALVIIAFAEIGRGPSSGVDQKASFSRIHSFQQIINAFPCIYFNVHVQRNFSPCLSSHQILTLEPEILQVQLDQMRLLLPNGVEDSHRDFRKDYGRPKSKGYVTECHAPSDPDPVGWHTLDKALHAESLRILSNAQYQEKPPKKPVELQFLRSPD